MISFAPRKHSQIDYLVCDEKKQILVCTLGSPRLDKVNKWRAKGAAIFELTELSQLNSLLKDLLANPQIRALCLDGDGFMKQVLQAFWTGQNPKETDISDDHLTLIRQGVSLFEEDCNILLFTPPYLMKPITYEE